MSMNTGFLVARADAFAALAHGSLNQRRKYSREPYIAHPRAVADLVRGVPHTDEMLAAALLHDVVEDTRATLDDVQREFGSHVARLVDQLTDRAALADGNRALRKAIEERRLARACPEAKTVKLADLLDNTASIVPHDPSFARVFLAEMQRLLFALEGGDTRLLAQAWRAVENGWRTLARV
jgi:(p)ppGpp synthase/HD superfamily hydrolase